MKKAEISNIPEVKISKELFRQPTFTLVVGKKGIGKTFLTKNVIIPRYVKGNPAKGVKGRKVLYFDVNNEATGIKTIPVDWAFDPEHNTNWVQAFSSNNVPVEARRVVPKHSDGTPFTINELNLVLEYLLKYFVGGLLIVEDTARYVSDNPQRDLTGALATIRHANCDVIAQFQYKSKALNPRFFGFANLIRIHKTNDTFKKYKDRIEGAEEILYLAETLEKAVNAELKLNATPEQIRNQDEMPIELFYCYVDMDKTKIRGTFTKEQFDKAAKKYIMNNKKDALDELLGELNEKTGKPIHTFEQAFKIKMEQLFLEYWGN
jgi:hypothetical protein